MSTATDRLAITCWPCRQGRHADCPGTIVISTGEWAGSHTCDCPSGCGRRARPAPRPEAPAP